MSPPVPGTPPAAACAQVVRPPISTIVRPRPAGCPLLSTDAPSCPSMPGVILLGIPDTWVVGSEVAGKGSGEGFPFPSGGAARSLPQGRQGAARRSGGEAPGRWGPGEETHKWLITTEALRASSRSISIGVRYPIAECSRVRW